MERFIQANSNDRPSKPFLPMKQEAEEDSDLDELMELINSNSELVAKLRDRPEVLSQAKCKIIGGTPSIIILIWNFRKNLDLELI